MYEFPAFMMPTALGDAACRRSADAKEQFEAIIAEARKNGRPLWLSDVPLTIEITDDRGDMRREVDVRFQSNNHREAVRILYELLDRSSDAALRFAKWYITEGLMWAGEIPYSFLAYQAAMPDPVSHRQLGMCYLYYDQYAEALEHFRTAIELAPKSDTPTEWLRASTYWSAGQLFQHIGDLKTAAEAYATAAVTYRAEADQFEQLVGHYISMREMVEFCEFAENFDPASLRDGIYTGSSMGYAAHVHVEVEIASGRIARVDITRHIETSPLDSLEVVPRRIVEEQSLNVDWVLGAKQTSRAIVAAAFRALEGAVSGRRRPARVPNIHAVQAIRHLTDSAFVVRLDRGEIVFQPGHHIDVGIAGETAMRKYSVYSTPKDDFLEILVIEVMKGRVTPLLHRLEVGDKLDVEGPMGLFLIPGKVRNKSKVLFVATGTGISPFHCFAGAYPDLDYQLLHGVRHREEIYEHDVFAPERVVSCISRETGESDDHFVYGSRVTDYLKSHPVGTETFCFLCGNADMIQDVSAILRDQGVPHGQVFSEEYF